MPITLNRQERKTALCRLMQANTEWKEPWARGYLLGMLAGMNRHTRRLPGSQSLWAHGFRAGYKFYGRRNGMTIKD